jgi:hypothetical protein
MHIETFPVETLDSCDLVVGATYLSGDGSLADEPINRLLRCGNQGGIRTRGKAGARHLVVLYTTFADKDWPDSLDEAQGRLVYYGDNKSPGHELHETPKGGNIVLRESFEALHVRPDRRREVPPFFVFSKAGRSRDVRFEGLAAPGAPGVPESEDLLAIWKTTGTERFQNYRAVFTILDAPSISRSWVDEVVAGRGIVATAAPDAWKDWVVAGSFNALRRI